MTIIHRRHRFIYLKSGKTAGTSLEVHLLKHTALGGDIWTTASEILKYGLPRRGPNIPVVVRRDRIYTVPRGTLPLRIWPGRIGPRVVEHQSAEDLAGRFGAFWEQALKVTSVRNPWDLLVSAWQWRRDGRGGRAAPISATFHEWAAAALSDDTALQERCGAYPASRIMHPFIFVDGKVAVDYMIRREEINDGLDRLGDRLGLSLGHITAVEKPSQRRADYRTYYTDELIESVADYFSDVIDITGYQFD